MPAEFDTDRGAALIPDLLDSLSVVDGGGSRSISGGYVAPNELSMLSGPADWARWVQQVEGLSRLWSIWDFVNPAESKELVEPQRPAAPKTPVFERWTKRELHETDADHEARLTEHKLRLDIVARTLAIKQEQHRVECIEYAIRLGEFTTAKEEMNQLNRIIYAAVDDKLRMSLTGEMTSTPRLKLKTLEYLVMGVASDTRSFDEEPKSRFIELRNKIESRGSRDWEAWAVEVADLSRTCEELSKSRLHNQLAKNGFLESIQEHDPVFHRRWSSTIREARNGERSVSFQDLADAFVKAQSSTTAVSEPDSVPQEKMVDGSKKYRAVSNNINGRGHSPAPSGHSEPYQMTAHKRCPGCRLAHRVKGDKWWQSCWYFDAYKGRKTWPSYFKLRMDHVDFVRVRLEAHPDEDKLATAWDLQRK
ncbi:hypothetical protein GQ602_007288 [Ophiocordyceps camponoti-floridani]|uniref:Uncharacterized protein n=1 Tax=Ophiocordyceps camponoti-floridani TaxID=2030778 RepID=A0A8H4Q143_9HYPO|nr:hypothetical protein GQ602_007288 [Ophiocordyceps camponoti-floridani]